MQKNFLIHFFKNIFKTCRTINKVQFWKRGVLTKSGIFSGGWNIALIKRITANPDVLWIVCKRSSVRQKKKKKHVLNDDGYSGIGERADVAGSDSSAYSF